MTDDEIIDKILIALKEADPGSLYVAEFCEKLELPRFAYKTFVDRIEAIGLANPHDPKHKMSISDKGREIIKSGGWLSHVEKENKQKQKAIIRQDREDEKLFWETKLLKWQVKSFWWVFIGGFFGGIMGSISLVLELEDRGYLKLPIELRKSQVDKTEISTNSTNTTIEPSSTSNHYKTSDTTNHVPSLGDSLKK